MQKLIRIIGVVLVILVVGWAIFSFSGGVSGLIPSSDGDAAKGYSAVFLSNDQVYFGKASVAGDVVVLKDVYYIRLNEAQPQIDENADAQQPQLSLVKLGDQIHGPADEMRINRDQVLFVERIKDESTVVKAIAQDKEQRSAQGDETPLNTNQTTDPAQGTNQTTDQTNQ